ncbi:unnamed protein product [Schistosoma haematobium]|nr:unnamed protein product [Schistosoma haematobium]
MNANLLRLLLAIVVTVTNTDIHAYRKGRFDRPVDESDTNAGMNDFDAEHNEGNRESNEINNLANRESDFDRPVDESDTNAGMNDFDAEHNEGNRESNEINDPGVAVDISSVISNARGFQLRQ